MKKKLLASIALTTLFFYFSPSTTASAEEEDTFLTENGNIGTEIIYEHPIEFFEESTNFVTPFYIPYDETVYEPTTKTAGTAITYNSEVINNSSTQDKVSRSVSRDKYVKGTIGSSTDLKLITAKVNVKAEVGFGTSTKVSTTYTWTIPAKTKTTIKFGSKTYKTSGYIVKYSRGSVSSKRYQNPTYTTGEYSSKVSKGL